MSTLDIFLISYYGKEKDITEGKGFLDVIFAFSIYERLNDYKNKVVLLFI